jgi:hypothetical protein
MASLSPRDRPEPAPHKAVALSPVPVLRAVVWSVDGREDLVGERRRQQVERHGLVIRQAMADTGQFLQLQEVLPLDIGFVGHRQVPHL